MADLPDILDPRRQPLCDDVPVLVFGDLYVGSHVAATHLKALRVMGITHIFSCLPDTDVHFDDVVYAACNMEDSVEQDLDDAIIAWMAFVRKARCTLRARILVHCHAGVSRSVSMIAAYLILQEHLDYFQAMALIRSRRPRANPNQGFCQQLLELDQVERGRIKQQREANESAA
jgi:protein-tyrosine phosphatase